jgi:hypothetical protein
MPALLDRAEAAGARWVSRATGLDGSHKRVQLEERPPDMHGPFGLATIVFALGLYVAAETIGWPGKFEIDRVLTG